MIKIEMSLEVKDLWSLLYLTADTLSKHAPLWGETAAGPMPKTAVKPEVVPYSQNEVPKPADPDPEEAQPEPVEEKKPAKKASGKKAASKKPATPEETTPDPEQPPVMPEPEQPPVMPEPEPAPADEQPAQPGVQEEPESDVITVEATAEGIKRAGAMLIDKDRTMMQPLMAVLKKFGVQAITQLKPEQYEGVAEEIRGLLAQVSGKEEVE